METRHSIASKLATMAAASTDGEKPDNGKRGDPISMSQLIAELSKQQTSFREDVATLIQESFQPLQAPVDGLREEVSSFQGRLVAAETLAGKLLGSIVDGHTTVAGDLIKLKMGLWMKPLIVITYQTTEWQPNY